MLHARGRLPLVTAAEIRFNSRSFFPVPIRMYTRFFGLSENPFALSPDPRYLYSSRRHQEALAHLTYGMTQGGGFVQLTGEVGTGKTMMIRTLLDRLPESVDVALVLYPYLTAREFIAAICEDLHIPYDKDDASVKPLIDALRNYLLANHARGRRTVLIIDEAQKLGHEILEQVRLLTNLETTKEKLLQILLIGQPELNQILAQQNLRQLAQRITARYYLKALTAAETREYIRHRLQVAGAKAELFSPAAVWWIHRAAKGTPRIVNVICDRALLGAYAEAKPAVGLRLARRAAAEVGQLQSPRLRPAFAAAAAIVGVVAIAAWQYLPPSLHPTAQPIAPAAPALPVAPPGTAEPVAAAVTPTQALAAAPALTTLLQRPELRTDTDAAFARLFARWDIDAADLDGTNGCERADDAGLRCALVTGTWNTLRAFNRPAIVELTDDRGDRHHVLLTQLKADSATLDFGGSLHDLPLLDIDRHWLGKALLLWRPPTEAAVLRRGMRGADVAWLRAALARGLADTRIAPGDLFDAVLETHVKEFQRRAQLPVDGAVGELTFLRLPSDDPSLTPAVTAASAP